MTLLGLDPAGLDPASQHVHDLQAKKTPREIKTRRTINFAARNVVRTMQFCQQPRHSLSRHEVKGRAGGEVADEAETVDGAVLADGHLRHGGADSSEKNVLRLPARQEVYS